MNLTEIVCANSDTLSAQCLECATPLADSNPTSPVCTNCAADESQADRVIETGAFDPRDRVAVSVRMQSSTRTVCLSVDRDDLGVSAYMTIADTEQLISELQAVVAEADRR